MPQRSKKRRVALMVGAVHCTLLSFIFYYFFSFFIVNNYIKSHDNEVRNVRIVAWGLKPDVPSDITQRLIEFNVSPWYVTPKGRSRSSLGSCTMDISWYEY